MQIRSRRAFISAALLGGLVGRSVLSNDDFPTTKSEKPSNKTVPLLLSHRTYSNEITSSRQLAGLVHFARAECGFSGLELSLEAIQKHCLTSKTLGTFLQELQVELSAVGFTPSCKDFSLTLSVDLAKCESPIESASAITKVLGIAKCTVSVEDKATPSSIASTMTEWHDRIYAAECVGTPHIMLESPHIYTGMEVFRLARMLRDTPDDVGVLVRSATSHYRFNMVLDDLQSAIKSELKSKKPRDFAARFNINVDGRSQHALEFEREVFRKAVVDQVIGRADCKPVFLAVESTAVLPLDRQSKSLDRQRRIFEESVELIRRDLGNGA